MTTLPLTRASIEPRVAGIERDLALLQEFALLSDTDFAKDVIQDRTHHHLRLAIEGMLNIASHIISRFPGGRETEYKKIMAKLGELGILNREFVTNKLVPIAGYRNRLTHLYAEVTMLELHKILKNDLGDIEKFIAGINVLLQTPEKFGLTIE